MTLRFSIVPILHIHKDILEIFVFFKGIVFVYAIIQKSFGF